MEAPPVIPVPTAARNRSMWWVWASAALVVAGLGTLFAFDPSHYGFYPRCALFTTTGLYCPGCGTQRSLYQLLHGNILTALRDNALFVLSLPLAVGMMARWLDAWRKHLPLPLFSPSPRQVTWATVIVILFTVLRNIPVAPFNYLAPP